MLFTKVRFLGPFVPNRLQSNREMKMTTPSGRLQIHFYSNSLACWVLETAENTVAYVHISLHQDKLTVYCSHSPTLELRVQLIEALVRYARENTLLIVAQCPFVHHFLEMNAEAYEDIWSRTGLRDR